MLQFEYQSGVCVCVCARVRVCMYRCILVFLFFTNVDFDYYLRLMWSRSSLILTNIFACFPFFFCCLFFLAFPLFCFREVVAGNYTSFSLFDFYLLPVSISRPLVRLHICHICNFFLDAGVGYLLTASCLGMNKNLLCPICEWIMPTNYLPLLWLSKNVRPLAFPESRPFFPW